MNSTIEYAYRRFATDRFPLPTESEIEALERRLNARLPDDYRRYLLDYNGGRFDEPYVSPVANTMPEANLEVMFGIHASQIDDELGLLRRTELFDGNDPLKILPVGNTASGGFVILSLWPGDEGQIYFKEAFGDFYFLADGIEEFFGLLRDYSPLDDMDS